MPIRIPAAVATLTMLTAPFLSGSALAADLGVDFKWSSEDRCSRSSPEIHVSNIPAGNASFKVRLRDNDVPSWRHGGGTVPADPSGVIAKGALTDGYNGPCPPDGTHHYEIIVKALNADGDTLAEGSAEHPFP